MDEAEASTPRSAVLRSGAVTWALRVTAMTALVAVGAAHYLARVGGIGEPPAETRLARAAPIDPETTGSIAGSIGSARQVRLDPCALLRH